MKTGIKRTQEFKDNLSRMKKGKAPYVMTDEIRKKISEGKKNPSQETREKMRQRMLGKPSYNKGKKHPEQSGKNHFRYIEDRSKLKRFNETAKDRRSYAYADWRKKVWERDNYKCRIANGDCLGRLEAHHILGYTDHPELRYEINNGITLCHFHHPKKRKDEKELSPYLQKLVAEMN